MPEAELLEDSMVIREESEASQIYNKGYFGTPQSGGALKLELMEGIFLFESGRIDVKKKGKRLTFPRLLHVANNIHPNFEIKYLVYRALRLRGYIVKPCVDPLDFRVFPRGGGPSTTPSKYWVSALSERSIFDLRELKQHLQKAQQVKKELLLAVVDEESDLTYYLARVVKPKGKRGKKRKKPKAQSLFLEDRVMVTDEKEARTLHEHGFYGKMIGNRLQLSLMETAYLLEKGMIEVKNAKTGRKIGLDSFLMKAREIQPDFGLRLKVFRDLEERGIVVKTGFKYGSHFRAYTMAPDKTHAKYLVHAFSAGHKGMWPEVSRAVRVSHGVKKDILFGMVGKEIEYVALKRVRP
ncbi:MAG: tRNA-intron lyase [Methanobacteriota archaeon]|nr:MAG: tRNA-intron lyase [Euryarchaeota archaeon]